ncbi:cell wall-binding repeat-containing protein [Streptomyces sp. NPDC050803]|uniref:cell wall-binding repeat-containing protein n=1 Tax=unclassified Streptomyces TaxID=2593676 RepID=UPI003430DC6F
MRSSGSSGAGTRRGLVALTAATALAAGLAVGAAPGASAETADWPATTGILTADMDGQISQLAEDGSAAPVKRLSDAMKPSWSPDGSRMAYVNQVTGRVNVVRYNFTGPVELPVRTTNTILAGDPTFWGSGSQVVFELNGRLRVAPSDGSRYQQHLFGTAQEGCDSQPSGAIGGKLAFIRSGSTCGGDSRYGALWVYDGPTGTFKKLMDGRASAPSISPDGTKVAYTLDQALYVINTDGTGATRLLPEETGSVRRPTWSPDGARLAYEVVNTSNELRNEILDLATGTTKVIYDTPSTAKWDLAWQPLRKNDVGRVWGADIYGTNIAGSRWTWNTVGQSEPGLKDASSAVLVSKDSQAYALTAPALAGKKGGPVLLTSGSALSSTVQTELKRILKPGATVYLVGGTSILSGTVASKVSALGFTPKRLAGTSRYSTSVAVAKAMTGAPTDVFLATGNDYHAALAAASAAGGTGRSGKSVVVLNDGNSLTASVKSYLNGLDPRTTHIIPVGGSAKYALTHTSFSNWPSTYSYYPVVASTHEGTAAALARFWWGGPRNAALADTDSWRGGATAGAAMNVYGPLLWTQSDALSTETRSYLVKGAANVRFVAVFGGTGSVSTAAVNTAGSAISASSSLWDYTAYYNGLEPAASPSALAATPKASPDLTALRTTATR